jgi:hypothetical protein
VGGELHHARAEQLPARRSSGSSSARAPSPRRRHRWTRAAGAPCRPRGRGPATRDRAFHSPASRAVGRTPPPPRTARRRRRAASQPPPVSASVASPSAHAGAAHSSPRWPPQARGSPPRRGCRREALGEQATASSLLGGGDVATARSDRRRPRLARRPTDLAVGLAPGRHPRGGGGRASARKRVTQLSLFTPSGQVPEERYRESQVVPGRPSQAPSCP